MCPESTTYTTSLSVIEVSAMLVAMMIFRVPAGDGRKRRRCSPSSSDEWHATTSRADAPSASASARSTARMASIPSTKTSTARTLR